jgi:long-chain acyl-CoA synthetase
MGEQIMKLSSTVPRMFLDVCDRYAGRSGKVAYARKTHGQWSTVTHDELRHDVECFAFGLLHMGVVPGERIGIVSENRVEWAIADFAITAMGCIDVPIFPTLTSAQVEYIYNNCEASCIIVSNAFQLKKVMDVWDAMPTVRFVITMQEDLAHPEGRVHSFASIMEVGKRSASESDRRRSFETMARHVQEDDLLTLIYTSGTTGHPKGVMLTHKNLMSNIAGALSVFDVNESDVLLSYLPMCHSYERMSGYYLAFAVGASTYIAESIETVAENMREVRPTVMTSVPRLFERIKLRVEAMVSRDSAIKQRIFAWALNVAERAIDGEGGFPLSIQASLADRLVFSKIRERTGGRLRFFISGGAALSVDVGRFFKKVGLTILEGYGLTETSPVLAVNREGEEELGTVGRPLPNVEIKIAADGEILARGPNVMRGYWRDEEATRDCLEPDGWFHTGDIGEFTAEGRLKITDRKKHILVSSGGKNVAPLHIEELISRSKLIDQVMLVGDKREFCTALIVPDRENVEAWADQQGLVFGSWEELVRSAELHKAVHRDIDQLQHDLSKYERVRRFKLLPVAFTVENGMLTPTLKVKRKVVLDHYADAIQAMYAE